MRDEPIITKVRPYPVQKLEYNSPMQLYRVIPDESELSIDSPELTFWDKVKLIPALFIILKGHLMGDLKTTISGVVKVGFQLATVFGIGTGHLTEAIVTSILWGIASIYQSYQQADKK